MTMSENIRNIGLKMQKEQLTLQETLLEEHSIRVSDEELVDGVDRLIYNHCLNKTQLRSLLGGAKATFNKKLEQAIEDGVISEPIYQNRAHLFTNSQVHALMNYWGIEKYSENHDSKVIEVQNHKGGTGKTSTAVVLANATALDLQLNANVLLVDLDPQGSAGTGVIRTGENDVYLTMCDLLLNEYEPDGEVSQFLDAGNSFEDIVKNTAFSTHLDNLSVITAFPTDDRFTDLYWSLDEGKQTELLTKLKNTIIPLLKEQYDFIYFDLPPQDSPITWSATEAADCILVPITPRYYDYASTTNFMISLAKRLESLPSKGNNIEWLKMVAVNYSKNSKPEYKTIQKLLRTVRSDFFIAQIAHSDAFTATAEIGRTIFDVLKSEEICTSHQLDLAQSSVTAFYELFKNEIITIAAK
ncbi:ParA family protein [Vibrio sp. TH_r3]|uniref:ParA family protein n=1 Tax=Vibrio sp. TH_r3 TaxID=3082084 RepID=UPI0029529BA1|nr:ParA family protein [Vibrio sp. TH_r3]MDV7105126.1 ParA family protein [Vibrio sp. TH_r3]